MVAAPHYSESVADEDIIGTVLPRASFGDPDCCGCLVGILRGDQAEIVCNECGAVIQTVRATELQRTLDQDGTPTRICECKMSALWGRALESELLKGNSVCLW